MKRIFLLLLLFCSCTVDREKLLGSWQAVAYYEMGQTINTPLNSVQLTFSKSGDYTFNSIGFYEEKGAFRLAGNYLFLRDTTAQNPQERALKVLFLSPDSLKLGMEVEGKSRTVFFGKMK